ncbi:MAG: hypothetical protein AAF497_14250, partial [Planctomycetota bacterium]
MIAVAVLLFAASLDVCSAQTKVQPASWSNRSHRTWANSPATPIPSTTRSDSLGWKSPNKVVVREATERVATTAIKSLDGRTSPVAAPVATQAVRNGQDQRTAQLLYLQGAKPPIELNAESRPVSQENPATRTEFDPFTDPFNDRHIDDVFESTQRLSQNVAAGDSSRTFRLDSSETVAAEPDATQVRLANVQMRNQSTQTRNASYIELHQAHVPFMAQRGRETHLMQLDDGRTAESKTKTVGRFIPDVRYRG